MTVRRGVLKWIGEPSRETSTRPKGNGLIWELGHQASALGSTTSLPKLGRTRHAWEALALNSWRI